MVSQLLHLYTILSNWNEILLSFTILAALVLTIPYMLLMELEIKCHFCLSLNTYTEFRIRYIPFKELILWKTWV